MGGGLLQLVAYGAQDAYISGNPQITFWKGLYKRHTNFAMEPFRINFNGEPNWGTKQTAIINRYADLMFSTYVQLELPTYDTAGNQALWNHGSENGYATLGYNFINHVELDIGGQIIDRLYSEYMFLWSALTLDYYGIVKLNDMLTNEKYNSSTLRFTPGVGCSSGVGRQSLPNILYIPLSFFFTRNPGTALPLIALQYHEVKINVFWKTPQEITGNFNATSGNPGFVQNLPQAASAALYVDYIYLDTDERRRFAQQSHEYLIEQVQFNEDVGISSANQRIDLTFNHPVKELIWVVQPSCYTDCKARATNKRVTIPDRLLPYVYDVPAVFEQFLQINGQDRLEKRYGDYFNKVQPYQHHTGRAPGAGVYMYSFAIKPEEHQPSGTCNFSRIDTATLVLTMDGGATVDMDYNTWDVRVYAVNYNVLRVMSGMGGLAFSN